MSSAAQRVLVADGLAPAGPALLRGAGLEVEELTPGTEDRLAERVAAADALLVRSRTRVDRDLLAAAHRLRVVGRAGNGVDNIDLDAASDRGILVVNTPTANLVSACEHAMALILGLARNLVPAHTSLCDGRWQRGRFVGMELQGKTLGVVGLGRIGQRVAQRARAFDMDVVACDPHLEVSVAERAGAALVDLDTLLERSDVVTLHLPLTASTRCLFGGERIGRMKQGALLVNVSRGGLVDEAALLAALEAGALAGAALDVFAEEPPSDLSLVRHPRVLATPHLGAQTREAQERVSSEVARAVLEALRGSLAVSAVNLPCRWPAAPRYRPYLYLAERLGHVATVLSGQRPRRVGVTLAGLDGELETPLTLAAVRGALTPSLGDSVNYVNAERQAASRGIEVVRSSRQRPADYPHLLSVEVAGEDDRRTVTGTVFGDRLARVVRIDRVPLEFRPDGRLLVLRTDDRPGVVGRVGTLLGAAGVNIADIHLARLDGEPDAWTVLRVDGTPPAAALDELGALPETRRVHLIEL